MAILFHRAGEQAKPLDFFRPRVRLSIVLVVVPNGQANTELPMISLSFLREPPHEFTKNVLLSMKVDSLFEI